MMKGKIFENGIQYSLSGDYYLPDLKLEPESRPIGRWGRMHRDYLKEHRPVLFNQLVLSGNLWSYLADINEQAQLRIDTLIRQIINAEGITEKTKESNQMYWVLSIDYAQNLAKEFVLNELIYV